MPIILPLLSKKTRITHRAATETPKHGICRPDVRVPRDERPRCSLSSCPCSTTEHRNFRAGASFLWPGKFSYPVASTMPDAKPQAPSIFTTDVPSRSLCLLSPSSSSAFLNTRTAQT